MPITELIAALEEARKAHGDLEIGFLDRHGIARFTPAKIVEYRQHDMFGHERSDKPPTYVYLATPEE